MALLMNIIPEQYGEQVKAWIRWKAKPVLKDYSSNPEVTSDVSDYVFELPQFKDEGISDDSYKIFINSESLLGIGTYYMSVEVSAGPTSKTWA